MTNRSTIGNNPLSALTTKHNLKQASSTEEQADGSQNEPETQGTRVPSPKETQEPSDPSVSSVPETTENQIPTQCLTFDLSGAEFAIGIMGIKEIVEFEPLTEVPTTPSWLRGVMNLRGRVIPVVDLETRLGMGTSEVSDRACIVIVEVSSEDDASTMGVLVSAVNQVLDFAAEDLEKTPSFGTSVHVEWLLGLATLEGRIVPILDLDQVLSTEDLITAASVLSELAESHTDRLPPLGGEASSPSPTDSV